MSKKHGAHHHDEEPTAEGAPDGPPEKMKEKAYQHELRRLHGELVAMQEWVKATGAKICIVFEGRDTAGKGGTIKAITERVSPGSSGSSRSRRRPSARSRRCTCSATSRTFRPAARSIIFDRSWYNRAGVERVDGLLLRTRGPALPPRWFPRPRRPWSTPASSS